MTPRETAEKVREGPMTDLHSPALRWLDPHSRGRYLTPAELERERAAIGDFGLTVVAAWLSADGLTCRYSRASSVTCEIDAR